MTLARAAADLAFALEPAVAADLDALVALRIAAMRESLQRIGRFDPVRARERFAATFDPALTQHIVVSGQRAGFIVVRPFADHLLLDHLYLAPAWQRKGLGAAVLAHLFTRADAARLPVRVGALRDSEANRFYREHGFTLTEHAEFDNYYVRMPRP